MGPPPGARALPSYFVFLEELRSPSPMQGGPVMGAPPGARALPSYFVFLEELRSPLGRLLESGMVTVGGRDGGTRFSSALASHSASMKEQRRPVDLCP